MKEILHISLLFDFYGELLTQKQKQIFSMYYNEDLSLSEIAVELDISRQGVRDQLKRTEKILEQYENKLKLVEKFIMQKKAVSEIKNIIEFIEKNDNFSQNTVFEIEKIKRIVDRILE